MKQLILKPELHKFQTCKEFAKEFEYDSILQHHVAKLPWTTITTIMDKIKDEQERE